MTVFDDLGISQSLVLEVLVPRCCEEKLQLVYHSHYCFLGFVLAFIAKEFLGTLLPCLLESAHFNLKDRKCS